MDKPNDVGNILKAERERRGLTLDVIQEATKIPIDSLKAIEEGYKIRTLTSFYYKSFVRLYAQYLGLDPLPVLAMIPSYQPVSRMAVLERPNAFARPDLRKLNIIAGPAKTVNWKRALPLAGAALAVLLVGGGLFAVVKHIAGKIALSVHQPVQVKAPGAAKGEKLAKVLKVVKTEKVEKVEKIEMIDKAEKTVKTDKPPVTMNPDTAETKMNVAAAVDVKDVKKVYLTVKASATTWLTVRSDGKVVFKGSLTKGSNESWSAGKKIEISGKGVNLLEYEVNGKNIGKLSRRDSNARRVVVTPEGLLVEK